MSKENKNLIDKCMEFQINSENILSLEKHEDTSYALKKTVNIVYSLVNHFGDSSIFNNQKLEEFIK